MIVIHHNKDLDGFSSGAICKLKYPDATLIGWDYKDPIPNIPPSQDIIMVDISFPIEEMIALRQRSKSLTWIDHHISAKKDFDKALAHVPFENHGINYVYDNTKAACEGAWTYLFPDKPIPYAITLLGRYDTWRQDEGNWNEETLPFQYFMRNECSSAENFNQFWLVAYDLEPLDYQFKMERAIITGKEILRYQKIQDELACERSAFEKTAYNGLKAICLNTRAFSSTTMESVFKPDRHQVMIGFEYTGNGKWSVSLRSGNPDIDVSIIAKERGGGGHKAAAGFEVDKFEDIFA